MNVKYAPPISEKADYAIAIGPQHPTHKEPIRFIFHVKGETIDEVDVRIGFNHRGIEKGFEQRTFNQNLYLAERLCGICSASHQFAYVMAAEKAGNIYHDVPERAHYIRSIILELERIQSHQLWYGVLAHDTGYDTMFQLVWRDREIVSDILEIISGNRVNYSMYTIGGVRRDITKEQIDKVIPLLKDIKKRTQMHKKVMMSEKSFIVRLKDVATLSTEDAKKFCTVGPTVRASGVNYDVRRVDPHAAYPKLDFEVPISDDGDVLAGMLVRLDETIISCDIIIQALENLPQGDIAIKPPRWKKIEGQGIARVEAPRGEDIHFVMAKNADEPYRHKIRAPTFANLPSLVHRLKGCQVADIPPVIRVIDPCIGCMERVTFVKDGKAYEMTGAHLKARSNKHYRLGTKVLDF